LSKIYLFSKTPSTSEGVIHIKILQTHYFSPPSNIYDYDFLIITSKEAINALLEIDKSRVELICISKKSAEYALKQNKEIFVLPHRLGDSEGTFELLKRGDAKLIYDIDSFCPGFRIYIYTVF